MTVSAEKQRLAEEVANMLAVSVDIDTSASKTYVDIPVVAETLLAKIVHIQLLNVKRVTSLDLKSLNLPSLYLKYCSCIFGLSSTHLDVHQLEIDTNFYTEMWVPDLERI